MILESRLVAVPEPEIIWYYKDTQLTSRENIVIASESDIHMYCSVVKISKVQKKQEGNYKIVAKNREGEATIEIPLKVSDKLLNVITIKMLEYMKHHYTYCTIGEN